MDISMIYYWEYNGTPDIELGNPVIINQQLTKALKRAQSCLPYQYKPVSEQ